MQREKRSSKRPFTTEDIVLDDHDPDPYKVPKKSHKRKKHHQKREVRVDTFQNMEKLVITQKVKIKKQKLKCIINLTNICEHRRREKLKVKRSTLSSERIVPRCFRHLNTRKTCKHKQLRQNNKESKKSELEQSLIKKNEKRELTPLFLTRSVKSSKLQYEDIDSSDSFTSDPDDDVDMLIKRTKDRNSHQNKSMNSSRNAPTLSDISDAELSVHRSSDKDSLHSTATLILLSEPDITVDTYSPTYPTTPTSLDKVHCLDDMNNYHMNNNHSTSYEENNFDVYVKREFSPTCNDEVTEKTGVDTLEDQFCKVKDETKSSSENICCDQDSYEVHIKLEEPEMDSLMDNTKNLISVDVDIEATPKIKEEKDVNTSPNNYHSIFQNDQSLQVDQSNSDLHAKVKVESDFNGNIDNETNYVNIKSEETEVDYKIKEED